ncbi:helix-turn-helix transcriptional regulator [Melghirimyces algeriensis]|uniref:Transcriptional regulator, AraC family n=1 Tax=Melghirimyces algeriensis TaxID=910412 RepID=A0A521D1U1_9BACL|nr:AraC family transcriptional regulator [Melghirimyces algeriensis]SMO65656.1 transcriptional regulator, AraC family [Melghirimyces algeriensis]
MDISMESVDKSEMVKQCYNHLGGSIQFSGIKQYWKTSQELGEGEIKTYHFQSGIELSIYRLWLHRPFEYNLQIDSPLISMKFCLDGYAPGLMDMKRKTEFLTKGRCNMYYGPYMNFKVHLPIRKPISFVSLAVDQETFYTFAEKAGHSLPAELANLQTERACFSSVSLTSNMHMALQQILHGVPSDEWMEAVYLESKATELFVLRLNQLLGINDEPKTLHSRDIERIRDAAEILKQDLTNPPSVRELALRVNLNESKLRKGFRELYHTTILGYLQLLRLDQASWLLKETDQSVTHISQDVGYSHISYFISLFKKRYGMTPNQYRSNI